MPIQPLSISEYQRIPDDEDVTPLDNTLSRNFKRTEKSVRFVVIVGVVLCVIGLAAFFGYHIVTNRSNNSVIIYSTSREDYFPTATSFSPKLSRRLFTDIPCAPSSDYSQADCISTLSMVDSKVILDNRVKYQKIIGFGGAFTESAAINFYKLPENIQKKVLNLYFTNNPDIDSKSGIGLTLGRIHINSCDFSVSSYNFDNVPKDYDLNFFDAEVTHDTEKIIPFLLAAMETSKSPIHIVASPWSPPPWMKRPTSGNNSSMLGSVTPNGLRDEPQIKLAWARYLSKFITAYKAKGINVWAITPQNEPEFPAPWEACAYNASFERDFIREYLGPVIKSDHPELLILAFDHNKDHLKAWTETILTGNGDASLSAAQFVDGMAFHCKESSHSLNSLCNLFYLGYGGNDRLTDGTYGYNNLNASYHIAPNKIFLNTEGCSCPGVSLGNWLRAERLGHDIIFDLLNYAQGWIDWNLIVDSKGGPNHLKNYCDASLITTMEYDDVIIQPSFSYFGHFSKFLVPDSVRISSSVLGNYKFEAMDSNIQPSVEIAAFPCEHSVRQMWYIHPAENYLSLATPSENNMNLVQFCVAYGDGNRNYLRLADCLSTTREGSTYELVRVEYRSSQLVDRSSGKCFTLADDVREGGALVELKDCVVDSSLKDASNSQIFHLNASTGEVKLLTEHSLCLTAGWPFLNAVAAETPDGKIVTVLMNDAPQATTVSVFDLNKNKMFPLEIPANSIQTIVY